MQSYLWCLFILLQLYSISLLTSGFPPVIEETCFDNTNNVNHSRSLLDNNKHRLYDIARIMYTNTSSYQVCFWRISTNISQRVEVYFVGFNITGQTPGCVNNYLQFNIKGCETSNHLQFCGSSFPRRLPLILPAGELELVLNIKQSSYVSFDLLFNTSFTTVDRLVVMDTPMYIFSPGYCLNYPKFSEYTWTLASISTRDQIMLEFLYFDMEDSNNCEYDFIHITGDKTNFRSCTVKEKFVLKLNNSDVKIYFETDFDSQHGGFVIKYFTVPNYDASCKYENSLDVYPYRPQVVNSAKTNGKICKWKLVAEADHVIILYNFISNTVGGSCLIQLTITEDDRNNRKRVYTCVEKAVSYYRSVSNQVEVTIVDRTQPFQEDSNFSFSYHSIPNNWFIDGTIRIDDRPAYIWIPNKDYYSPLPYPEYPPVQLVIASSVSSKCIQVHSSTFLHQKTDNINDLILVYNGDNKNESYLSAFNDGENVLGTRRTMLIERKDHQRPIISFGFWLIIELQSDCLGYFKEVDIDETKKIISPGFPVHYPERSFFQWMLIKTSESTTYQLKVDVWQDPGYCRNKLYLFENHQIYKFMTNERGYKLCLNSDETYNFTSNKLLVRFQPKNDAVTPFRISINQIKAASCDFYLTAYKNEWSTYTVQLNNEGQEECLVQIQYSGVGDGIIAILYKTKNHSQPDFTITAYDDDIRTDTEIANYYWYWFSSYNKTVQSESRYLWLVIKPQAYGKISFNIHYKVIDKSEETICGKRFQANSNKQYISYDHAKYVFDASKCSFIITRGSLLKNPNSYLTVEVIGFDMPETNGKCNVQDYVTFHNGETDIGKNKLAQLCGYVYKTMVYTVPDSMLINVYQSGVWGGYKGFHLKFYYDRLDYVTSCAPGSTRREKVEWYPKYLSPPGIYPSISSTCQWLLESSNRSYTIKLVFTEVHQNRFVSRYDGNYIAVYDGSDSSSTLIGQWYSNQNNEFTSSGNNIFIKIGMNSYHRDLGFKMMYLLTSKKISDQLISEDSGPSTRAIAGIVSGVVGFVIILVCGVCTCYRVRKNKQLNSSATGANINGVTNNITYNNTNNTVFVVSPVFANNLAPPSYEESLADVYNSSDLPPAYTTTPDLPPVSELPSYEESASFELPSPTSPSSHTTGRRVGASYGRINTAFERENPQRPPNSELPSYEESPQFELPSPTTTSVFNIEMNREHGLDNRAFVLDSESSGSSGQLPLAEESPQRSDNQSRESVEQPRERSGQTSRDRNDGPRVGQERSRQPRTGAQTRRRDDGHRRGAEQSRSRSTGRERQRETIEGQSRDRSEQPEMMSQTSTESTV